MKKHEVPTPGPLLRSRAAAQAPLWAAVAGATLCATLCTLAIPALVGLTLDDLRRPDGAGARLPLYVALTAASALGAALSGVAVRLFAGRASRRVSSQLRGELFEQLTRQDRGFYQRQRVGDLMQRFTSDLEAVEVLLGMGLALGLGSALSVAFALGGMLWLSPRLGLLICAAFPGIILGFAGMIRVLGRRYGRLQAQQSRLYTLLQETFSGIRAVKGLATEDERVAQHAAVDLAHRREALGVANIDGALWPLMAFVLNCLFVGVLALGRWSGLTLGQLLAFVGYLFQLAWPLLSVGTVLAQLQRARLAAARLQEVLSEAPGVQEPAAPRAPARPRAQGVRFERVGLTLGGRALLQDVSFEAAPGRTVAITGGAGAGKSLIAALLARLVDPTQGRVLIDGVDARELPLAWLRAQVGLVPQEPLLFSGTLAENIALALPPPLDLARVEQAAEFSGLARDLAAFPAGLQTRVGERGVTLSGGQRARVAFARAWIKQAPITVLDDVMSALDAHTEAALWERLAPALADKTTLLISHRAENLLRADQLLVLEDGRVVEQGAPSQLAGRAGPFARLVALQALRWAPARERAPA